MATIIIHDYYPLGNITTPYPYPLITNSNILNRSSNIGDLSLFDEGQDSAVEVINMDQTEIKTVLSETTNLLSLLSKSININNYAEFSPITKSINGTTLNFTNTSTDDFNIGDFTCYNHDAIQPYISSPDVLNNGTIQVTRCNYTPDVTLVDFDIYLGELNWESLGVDIDMFCIEKNDTTDSTTTIETIDFSDFEVNTSSGIDSSITLDIPCDFFDIYNDVITHDYTIKLYFADSNSGKTLDIPIPNFGFSVEVTNTTTTLLSEVIDFDGWIDSTNGCSKIWDEATVECDLSISGSVVNIDGLIVNLYIGEPEDDYSYGYGSAKLWYKINSGTIQDPSVSVNLTGNTGINNISVSLGTSVGCTDTVTIIVEPTSCP